MSNINGTKNADGSISFTVGGMSLSFPAASVSPAVPKSIIYTVSFVSEPDITEVRKAWAEKHNSPYTTDDQGNIIFDDATETLWDVTKP